MAKRVLVTNDDGIDGPGLRVLVGTLADAGYDPLVVAPNSDYSGAGTSVISQTHTDFSGGKREIGYEKRTLPEAPNAEAYALAAPPAMCALMAMRGAFGEPPSQVASGINYGLNTGPAIRHSGTVAAAMTAAGFGVSAIAVSAEHPAEDLDAELRFDTAAELTLQLLELIDDSPHQVLNLNVPLRALDDLAGIRSAAVSDVSSFFSQVEERTESVLKIGYQVSDKPLPDGTDSALVKQGFAAVSALVGPTGMSTEDLIDRLKANRS